MGGVQVYAEQEDADDAIEAMDGVELSGRAISVRRSGDPAPERPPRGGDDFGGEPISSAPSLNLWMQFRSVAIHPRRLVC